MKLVKFMKVVPAFIAALCVALGTMQMVRADSTSGGDGCSGTGYRKLVGSVWVPYDWVCGGVCVGENYDCVPYTFGVVETPQGSVDLQTCACVHNAVPGLFRLDGVLSGGQLYPCCSTVAGWTQDEPPVLDLVNCLGQCGTAPCASGTCTEGAVTPGNPPGSPPGFHSVDCECE